MLINRRKVKEFALEMAKHRAHKFTRVGSELLHQVRSEPQDVHSQSYVHSLPSKGKTIL